MAGMGGMGMNMGGGMGMGGSGSGMGMGSARGAGAASPRIPGSPVLDGLRGNMPPSMNGRLLSRYMYSVHVGCLLSDCGIAVL